MNVLKHWISITSNISLECLKKNPKKEIRNMKQYLLVTLMNVQANYEGAKLNKNKTEEEEKTR